MSLNTSRAATAVQLIQQSACPLPQHCLCVIHLTVPPYHSSTPGIPARVQRWGPCRGHCFSLVCQCQHWGFFNSGLGHWLAKWRVRVRGPCNELICDCLHNIPFRFSELIERCFPKRSRALVSEDPRWHFHSSSSVYLNAGNASCTKYSYFYLYQFTISHWISPCQNIVLFLISFFTSSHKHNHNVIFPHELPLFFSSTNTTC